MELNLQIKNKAGLHARPAALFAQKASSFKSTVMILKGEKSANAKSIISIMGLGIKQGESIVIKTEGADATEAATALKKLVDEQFGEE
ncbi:HPr family phosphocarrier protein [Pelosinus sp. sgz500959]|uniref:HPr family phosphocarrier protein n=1 Tax=Pelosinus sp. sgz500959 TaxID=3242472 RepID=UPI0036726C18